MWFVAPFIFFALFIVSAHTVDNYVHTRDALASHLLDLLGDAFLNLRSDGGEFTTET